jgi:hypothetical protein
MSWLYVYLGPQDLRLEDQAPADIALDVDYRRELQRRDSLLDAPSEASAPKELLKQFDQRFTIRADNPLFLIPQPLDMGQPDAFSRAVHGCLDIKHPNDRPP